jgi:VWFA-related protein
VSPEPGALSLTYDVLVRTLTVGLLTVCAASLAWLHSPAGVAGATSAETQAPTAQTIFIDASVTDDAGRAVTTLRPQDVRVTVDGERRPVVSLRFVYRGPGAETAAELADPTRDAPAAAERTRSLLLLVDENSITRGLETQVVATAARVLDELGAADQAAVASLPRPPGRIAITTELADRQEGLARVTGRAVRTALADASLASAPAVAAPPASPPGAGGGEPVDPSQEVPPEPRAMLGGTRGEEELARSQMEAGTRGTMRALVSVIDAVRGLPGMKAVVLFRQAGSGDGSPASGQDDYRADIDAAVTAAARARAVIHLVVVGTASRRRGAPDDDLRDVAQGTGGTITFAKDAADAKAFEVLRAALRGGYLVEVEATGGDASSRPRPVKVEVARPRTTVRAARSWAPRTDPVPPVAVPSPPPEAAPTPAGGTVRPKAPADPRLVLLLARVSEYVDAYVRDFGNIVAEEDYKQQVFPASGRPTIVRQLRSDLVIVRTENGWLHFRDVFEVDGKPVRDREARVQKLLLDDPEGVLRRGKEISNESARYNIGTVTRTINLPTLPLAYLGPTRIGGLTFRRDGEETVGGIRAAKLAFKEVARPTLVRPIGQPGDVPATGTFSVDPDTGRILKTSLSASAGRTDMTTTVTYRPVPAIGLWLPAEMTERYMRSGEIIEGQATYRNFRSFKVTTDVQIKK